MPENHYTESLELSAPESADGMRLDRFLSEALPEFSRSRLQSLIKSGHVTVDGARKKPRDPVAPFSRISVRVPPAQPAHNSPEPLPVTILHEDTHLVVVDKAPGMVVHPGAGNATGTLVNALLHRFGSLSQIGGVERPGIVHRLDKETTGCLVVARNDRAHASLSKQFAERMVTKHYLAVVRGRPATASGRIETNIGRNPHSRQKMAVLPAPKGKPAVTDWRVITTRDSATLLLCTLHTGRTHQIRVHMKHLGHPILGDTIYGKQTHIQEVGRLMLHAWRLGFIHPTRQVPLQIEAPPPAEFTPWLEHAGPLLNTPDPKPAPLE